MFLMIGDKINKKSENLENYGISKKRSHGSEPLL